MREVLLPAGEVDKSIPEKVIRVQGSASHGGYLTMPNRIVSRVRKELSGAEKDAFSYIWTRTVGFRRIERQIPFAEFVENGFYQERTVGDALLRLEELDWITIRRNGNRPNIYGVNLQFLDDYGCLENLPTDGGESPDHLPADDGKSASANFADQTSAPPCIPPDLDLGGKESTHSTPVSTTTGNGPEPEPERGCEGYVVSQPGILEQEREDRYRTYFDPHAEIREPEPEPECEGYDIPRREVEIPDHPVARKLKGCRLHPTNIAKFMRQYDPEHIMVIVRNFEADMGEPNNVEVEDYPRVLCWRLRNDVTSWEPDSWVSDVQERFDQSVKMDKSAVLGLLEYTALEQGLELPDVMAKLQLHGVGCDDLRQWASIGVRSDFHD